MVPISPSCARTLRIISVCAAAAVFLLMLLFAPLAFGSSDGATLLPIVRDGRYGFANTEGEVVIPCQWEYAAPFHEGLALVINDENLCGFIDTTGHLAIPCQWLDAAEFINGLAPAENAAGDYGMINPAGEVVIPCQWNDFGSISDAPYFVDGLMPVENNEDQ